MHFETREDYVAWALVMFFSTSEKTNSNAAGNALAHANQCADLIFGAPAKAPKAALPMRQPPSTPNKAPPVPGEKVTVPGVSDQPA